MHGNAYNWKQDEERRILAREAEDVSRRKLYDGKAKYGGMNVSQALEAKGLRDENTRWRKLGADLSLDKGVLQSVTEKTDGAPSTEAAVEQVRGSMPSASAGPVG